MRGLEPSIAENRATICGAGATNMTIVFLSL